jgi:hypothetical protein
MIKDKNSSCNIIKFKIDASKFNSTMDRLANNYSTPKKVTEFERKVGRSVCRAAELAMSDLEFNADQPKYRLVSAPTGGSKTSSSIALLAMLANEDPEFSAAYICTTIEECEAQYSNLKKLVDPSILAVFSSLHMFNPKPHLVAEKKEINVVASDHFEPECLQKKQLVITTHSRWENEIKSSKDLGVRKYRDRRRNLIIVDEEPKLCSTYPCLPHYVSELADVVSSYSDSIKNNSDNFSIIYEANELTKILRRIYTKMADLTDTSIDKATYIAADLIEDVEYEYIFKLNEKKLKGILESNSKQKNDSSYNKLLETIFFLQSTAEGRGFHTRQGNKGFYAYKGTISAEAGTMILDGTADLNKTYSMCKGMEFVDVPLVDYKNIELIHVTPPPEFKKKLRPEQIMKSAVRARPYMKWLREFVEKETSEKSQILIIAKIDLLRFDLHRDPDDKYNDPNQADWNNRHVYFCNYGRGRGSNKWKDCDHVFLLGDWHLKTATVLSRIGAVTNKKVSDMNLNMLGAPRSKDPLVQNIRESHLLTNFKQMAARSRLREINDDGVASHSIIYSVDGDRNLLLGWKDILFPGSPGIKIIGKEKLNESDTSTQKLADLLLTTSQNSITFQEIQEKCGIESKRISKALGSKTVKPVLKARNWVKKSMRQVFGYGRGIVLVRI